MPISEADSDDLLQLIDRHPSNSPSIEMAFDHIDEEELMNLTSEEPTVPLLGGGGDSWDDGELIRGWESAAEEFNLHNPGPGSWLDKATAALAVGNPLPGAKSTASKWYSSTPAAGSSNASKQPQNQNPSKSGTSKKNGKKRKQAEVGFDDGTGGGQGWGKGKGRQNGLDVVGGAVNPYAGVGAAPKRARVISPSMSELEEANDPPMRGESPSFTPGSPIAYSPSQPVAGPSQPSHSASHSNGYPPAAGYVPTDSGVYPPIGAASGVGRMGGNMVTREEASVRAVNAQWWAGYWFAMSELLPTAEEMM